MWLAINWTVDSQLIEGLKTPNLYGLLFVGGLTCGYFVVNAMFKKEGMPEKSMDQLVLYMVLSTIIGARLGHVFFYGPYWGPDGYFSNPGEIIKVWEGGLASHGAAVAILIALWYYSRKVVNKPYLWILDRIAPAIAIAGCFIRLGNLVNHEIVGDPTDVPWAFSFQFYYNEDIGNFDPTPRHPAQLYEAIGYLLLWTIQSKRLYQNKAPGLIMSQTLLGVFVIRWIVEYFKASIHPLDGLSWLTMGQTLSLPFIAIALILIYLLKRRKV